MNTPPQIHIHKIPSGYRGTLKTVEHVSDLIKQGGKDFTVRQTAIDILLQRAVKPKDYVGEIKALFEWVQQNIRYTKDTFRVEVLHSAKRMLVLRCKTTVPKNKFLLIPRWQEEGAVSGQ